MGTEALISIDPERMSGAPCFAGTRVPVSTLFVHLADGDTLDDFLQDFPSVTRDQAIGVLHAACVQVCRPTSPVVRHTSTIPVP